MISNLRTVVANQTLSNNFGPTSAVSATYELKGVNIQNSRQQMRKKREQLFAQIRLFCPSVLSASECCLHAARSLCPFLAKGLFADRWITNGFAAHCRRLPRLTERERERGRGRVHNGALKGGRKGSHSHRQSCQSGGTWAAEQATLHLARPIIIAI